VTTGKFVSVSTKSDGNLVLISLADFFPEFPMNSSQKCFRKWSFLSFLFPNYCTRLNKTANGYGYVGYCTIQEHVLKILEILMVSI
jgi:hypothetical protein